MRWVTRTKNATAAGLGRPATQPDPVGRLDAANADSLPAPRGLAVLRRSARGVGEDPCREKRRKRQQAGGARVGPGPGSRRGCTARCVRGRLDELRERTAMAYNARTWTDLDELIADLPLLSACARSRQQGGGLPHGARRSPHRHSAAGHMPLLAGHGRGSAGTGRSDPGRATGVAGAPGDAAEGASEAASRTQVTAARTIHWPLAQAGPPPVHRRLLATAEQRCAGMRTAGDAGPDGRLGGARRPE